MKTYAHFKITTFILIALLIIVSSCKNDDNQVVSEATINKTISEIISGMKDGIATQTDVLSVLGREYWRFNEDEPEWADEVVAGVLDASKFYVTDVYAARYHVIEKCNRLITQLDEVVPEDTFTEQETAAIRGFANTIKAHELLILLNLLYENAPQSELINLDNLEPFDGYSQGLSKVIALLETAYTDLEAAGDTSFLQQLGGDIPYAQFNRALTARAAAYLGDYTLVNTSLNDSFMDLAGDLNTGVYLEFSAEETNPLFTPLNSLTNARIAHPDFVPDALAGDTRVDKVVLRDVEFMSADLSGSYDFNLYADENQSIPLIRNEELILLNAEANHISNPAAAVQAVNIVRSAAGLADVAMMDPEILLLVILEERRYSLYGEGHRWIDMRRFDKLDQLPLDRLGDVVAEQFPIQ